MENGMEKTQMANGPMSNATQMIPTSGGEATQMGMMVTCPVCHSTTPAGEQYCSDCGFLLSSTPVEVAANATPPAFAKLVDVSSGQDQILNPGANTIGRENADVLVMHPTVSRRHAKLTVAEGRYLLEDVGSTNGTFAGNVKVEPGSPVEVKDGTEIRFGSAAMRLEAPEPPADVAVAEVEEAEKREELAEQAAGESVPSVDEEATEEAAADAAEATVMPIAPGVEAEFDATPAESLEAPIEPEEVQEEAPALARLIPAAGGDEYQIKDGDNSIGRRPANSISVPDPFISGSHATIAATDGKFVLTDIGSTNGTFVNGEKLNPNEPKELSDGDEVKFAEVVFRFTV